MPRNSNSLKSNAEAIEEAGKVQDRTQEAIRRMQRQAAQTEEVGAETLQQLQEQRLQAEKIELDAVRLDDNLNKTAQLQSRLDRWAGRWGRKDTRKAKAEVKREMELEHERQRIEKEKKKVATTKTSAVVSASIDQSENTPSSFAPPKKSKLLKQRPKKKKNPDSEKVEAEKLDAETKEGLEKIGEKDEEIDSMLDQTAVSLERIAHLTKAMGEETRQQNEKIDNLTTSLEKSDAKQRVVSNRVKRFLGGNRRKDQEEQKSITSSLPPTTFM